MSLPAWQIPGAVYPLPDDQPTWTAPLPLESDRRGLINDFVIFVKFGGLGDHLFFSHIPRIAKESGYDKVYVSTASAFRHDDYKEIWTANPFCDGFADLAPRYLPCLGAVPAGQNLLDRKMLDMGLDDGKRFHEPEFYYKPKILEQYRDATVFDPNFITGVGLVSSDQVAKWMSSAGVKVDYQIKWRKVHCGISEGQMLDTPTLHDYCDVIHSCKHFVAMTSGGATLAAALGKGCTALFGQGQATMFHHSPICRYVKI